MSIIHCDRCNVKKEYKEDYLFNDSFFLGDNGNREIFKEDEIVCLNCIKGNKYE